MSSYATSRPSRTPMSLVLFHLVYKNYYVNPDTGEVFNVKHKSGKPLKISRGEGRYNWFLVYWDGHYTSRKLEEIVYEAKHGLIPKGKTVVHIDGNEKNNALSNLALLNKKDVPRKPYLSKRTVVKEELSPNARRVITYKTHVFTNLYFDPADDSFYEFRDGVYRKKRVNNSNIMEITDSNNRIAKLNYYVMIKKLFPDNPVGKREKIDCDCQTSSHDEIDDSV